VRAGHKSVSRKQLNRAVAKLSDALDADEQWAHPPNGYDLSVPVRQRSGCASSLFGRIRWLNGFWTRRSRRDRRFGRGGVDDRPDAVRCVECRARRRWRWATVNDQIRVVHGKQGGDRDGRDKYRNDHRFSESGFHVQ
jgi:hypothetical protein